MPLKWSMFMSNGSIWWGEFISCVFFYLLMLWKNSYEFCFIFRLILIFCMVFWVFKVIDRFITISKAFLVKNKLKTCFWVKKKHINLNFSDIWWLIVDIKYSRTIWDQIPSYFQNFLTCTCNLMFPSIQGKHMSITGILIWA